MKFTSKAFKIGSMDDKTYLWIEIPQSMKTTVQEFISSLADKLYSIEIKLHREKRSPDSNSYMWTICDKIAKSMHDGRTKKEDIYRHAIRDVGEWEDKPIANEDVEKHIAMWGKIGDGWFSEERRDSKLVGHKVVRDYYGSHIYDTASMSRLIDYIVEEAKELGIETDTPDEIARVKASWGKER